ncbi:hypothetical protein [Brevibacterium jeotgali]|uniref:Serine/threonine protein kinase n=1 Tax=Brevibacterium jeotgali TaxID=1262550 RepID=A0A2H1L4Z3_9MICO|nr:hypothetical protein [Brevibacterium jeotgali]TWC01455.1 hypothetical protein FB108_0099 [Brevibacterium jeotgali]SMY11939.1 hypothetical protein BJEO58_01533 [Brevibacterium jeotgali]
MKVHRGVSYSSGGHQVRIERGTVIADRYVVSAIERPWLADTPESGVVCLALDAILDDPVILYAADAELSGGLLDSGRRLALVNDPRVPSVLDVGSADLEDGRPVDYVVCERTAATSLAEVLSAGPIGPEEARAVTGEVSEVLVHAGRRGLHHRCLGPESIGIMTNGDVVVHGIAIDAALSEAALGLEVQTDTTALREDALAIVDILYACLSGQWPKPESRAGLPAAPRKNQRVVEIETLRSDVPEDLTAFLTGVTSFSDPGPRSPGEIVRYLREWNRDSLANLEGSPLPDEELFADDIAVPGHTSSDGRVAETVAETADSAPATDPQSAAAGAGTADAATGTSDAEAPETDATAAASTSTGAGTVGAKPTVNLSTDAPVARKKATGSTVGMGSTGSRPTTTPPPRPTAPIAPLQRQATPDQIQAALARIGMSRPGTSGYSAGRSDGVVTKLDERMQMREASVFPLSAEDLSDVDTEEWTPEQTYTAYEDLSATEYDRDVTAPILDRDALWDPPEDVSTQSLPIVPDLSEDDAADDEPPDSVATGADDDADTSEVPSADDADPIGSSESEASTEDDGSWFLGGVFTTREEEIEQQRIAFERERALERRRAEAAQQRVIAAEARSTRQRESSQRESDRSGTAQTSTAAASTSTSSEAGGAAETAEPTTGGQAPGGQTAGARTAGPQTAGAKGAAVKGTSAAASPSSSGGPAGSGAGSGAGSDGPAQTASGSAGARRRRTVTLLVLALLVVTAIVIGIITLGGSSNETAAPAPEPTQQSTPADEETEEPEPQAAAPVIDEITAIDPEGDDEENSDEAELVMPGESGGWRSERYNTPDWGGLKSGVGLMVELEEESEITQLDFLAPTGTSLLEVRVGDSDDVEEAETVEEVELDGDVTVELDEPAIGQYVFLWFTEATAEGGGYRAMIDEVDIS